MMDCLFLFCFCLFFFFKDKNTLFPVFIFFSPQLAEGACNYPTQVIDYNLIKNLYIFFCFTLLKIYLIKENECLFSHPELEEIIKIVANKKLPYLCVCEDLLEAGFPANVGPASPIPNTTFPLFRLTTWLLPSIVY